MDRLEPEPDDQANDGGGTISVNGGETWARADADGAVLSRDHHMCRTHLRRAGQQHRVRVERAGREAPADPAAAPSALYPVGGGEVAIASDPRNPDVFYAGSYGHPTRLDSGQEAPGQPPDNPWATDQGIAERFQWTFPIVAPPTDSGRIAARLEIHQRRGRLGRISGPRAEGHGRVGGPITKDNTGVETYATVFSLAPSPKDAGVIWSGSDDGFVHVTRNGGTNWKNVTPKAVGDFARISLIEASPFRAGTAYVAANRYQQDDFKPYVFRTDDYGETWTAITNGVGATDFARAIREDRDHARVRARRILARAVDVEES